jgi:thiosulfate reductase cytochrome b subunit
VTETPVSEERRDQPLVIRITHWLNVPLLVLLAMSGLQILVAYPYLGPSGALYGWYPFQGHPPPSWMRLGAWLAGARALHFFAMWPFLLNGAIYLGALLRHREWSRRAFLPARDGKNALLQGLAYLRLRKEPPAQGFYNGLQRLGYTSALVLGVVLVLSGLGVWKPVQLSFIAALFGGYDGARAAHLLALAAMAGFVVGHVAMVLLHPKTFPPMLTGGAKRVPTSTDLQ